MSYATAAVAGGSLLMSGISLFGNKPKQTGSKRGSMYNHALDGYTKQMRAAAPWSFATLDPTATLAAMVLMVVLA